MRMSMRAPSDTGRVEIGTVRGHGNRLDAEEFVGKRPVLGVELDERVRTGVSMNRAHLPGTRVQSHLPQKRPAA